MSESLSNALEGRRLLAIKGPNFSGRTDLLRQFCRDGHKRIYLGPEVYNAPSGLAMSVRQEIELHAGVTLDASGMKPALDELQLTPLLEQNPGILSGGEQACLAVLCGIALDPDSLAIDCALEQLDSDRLAKAVSLLSTGKSPRRGTVVTDNRLDEWPAEVATADIEQLRGGPVPVPPQSVPPLAPQELERLKPLTAPTIALEHIAAGYRRRPGVLKDITLELQPGRVYELLGPNGAGKSTLAKVLCGVLRRSAGQIRFSGQPALPWKLPGRTVGYHLQNPDVGLFEASVAAELGKSERAQIVMDAFGLRGVSQVNPLSLPFPVRKRVSLAATIAGSQPWIFLDEPTLGSDAATIAALAKMVRCLADKGHGMIVISHSRAFARLLRGVELHMQDGTIHSP